MSTNQIRKLDLTLAILKPHIIQAPIALKEIQTRILNSGFFIVRTRVSNITQEEAHNFYYEHKDKFFFNRLMTFMCSGPCHMHILAGEDAIKKWRSILGPTKVFQTIFSHPLSVRGMYGLTDTRNAGHGSDSLDSARKEIGVFFPMFNVNKWYDEEQEKYVEKQCIFDKAQFVHIPQK